MSAAALLLALWALFALTHMGPSSLRLRPRLVAALGERGFLGAYSLVSIALFTALVWTYLDHRHQGPLLWSPPALGAAGRWTIYALQGVAWTLVAAGAIDPSPATALQSEAQRAKPVRGVHRLTRHPVFMGVGLFGALHLLVMGSASDVAFWAGFPVFAAAGCWHQDRRKLASDPAYRTWYASTPFVPFTGPDSLRGLRELSPLAVALGIGLAAGFRLLHGPLFH